MERLVVGAWLVTCALSNKNEVTVIKTRLGWGTPKVVQKYSKSAPWKKRGYNHQNETQMGTPKVIQK